MMSHVPNEGQKGVIAERAGYSASIADLLAKVPVPAVDAGALKVRKIANAKERAVYWAMVRRLAQARPILATVREGEGLRNRVVRVLGQFASTGTVTLGVGQRTWQRAYELGKMCAAAKDWPSQTGAIIGASNAVLEERLGTVQVRRVFRELAAWGLIVPLSPKGNGHRLYVPAKGGAPAKGCGWSLLPLSLMIDYLEEVAQDEAELMKLRVALPQDILNHVNAMRSLIKPFLEEGEWASALKIQIEEVATRRTKAKRSTVAKLQAILEDAINLSKDVEAALLGRSAPDSASKVSSRPDTGVHLQYNRKLSQHCSDGSAAGRRASGGSDHEPCSKGKMSEKQAGQERDQDQFGIVRSGFSWSEAPALFPWAAELHDGAAPTAEKLQQISRFTGISGPSVGRAIELVGMEVAMLCVLITGQHHSEGQVQRTPEVYFRGMLKRARDRDLNIGHTLFGRREKCLEPDGGRTH